MVISINKEEFEKIQHLLMIKKSQQTKTRRGLPQTDKRYLQKKKKQLKTNIMLTG